MIGSAHAAHRQVFDVPDATFTRPDSTTFAGLDEFGLEVIGQLLEPDRAMIACRVGEPDVWCRRCDCEGTLVTRDQSAGA